MDSYAACIRLWNQTQTIIFTGIDANRKITESDPACASSHDASSCSQGQSTCRAGSRARRGWRARAASPRDRSMPATSSMGAPCSPRRRALRAGSPPFPVRRAQPLKSSHTRVARQPRWSARREITRVLTSSALGEGALSEQSASQGITLWRSPGNPSPRCPRTACDRFQTRLCTVKTRAAFLEYWRPCTTSRLAETGSHRPIP